MRALLVALLFATPALSLTDTEIQEAIELGRQYANAEQVWEKEFEKTNKVKIDGYWNYTGAKVVRVLTDRAKVTMASAEAARQMKPFTVDDARALPDLGRLHAVLRVSCRCDMTKIAATFADNRAHMVLEFGEMIVQPEEKRWLKGENNYGAAAWYFLQTGNVIMAQPISNFAKSSLIYEFLYPEPPTRQFRFVLVGHKGKRFTAKTDASRWR